MAQVGSRLSLWDGPWGNPDAVSLVRYLPLIVGVVEAAESRFV